ncbi:MAG: MauE/DoxX family redox-associated membrane protein [Candidatus Acidiferrales bacterium]
MTKQSRGSLGRIFLLIGRVALGAIFIVTAYSKLRPQLGMPWSIHSLRVSLSLFTMQVYSYQMLSSQAASILGHFLPFFELFLGLWLVTGIALRYSSLLATLALCGFMAAIASAYHRGLTINCGCGIGPEEPVGPAALVRDGLMFLPLALAVTIGAFLIQRTRGDAVAPPDAAVPAGQRAE